jgi:hypothetical protein
MNISGLKIGTFVLINGKEYRYNGSVRIGFVGTWTLQHEFIDIEGRFKYFSVNGDTKLEIIDEKFYIKN